MRPRSRGLTVVSVLIYLAIAAAVYWAVVFGPAYWENRQVKSVLVQAGNLAYREKDDAKVRKFILGTLDRDFPKGTRDEPELDFDPQQDLVIERTESPPLVTIELTYDRHIKLPLTGGTRIVQFRTRVQQDLSVVKW